MNKTLQLIIGMVAGAVGYLAVQYYFDGGFLRQSYTKAQIEEQIAQQPGASLFETLKRGYPDAYDAYLGDIQRLADQSDGIELSNAVFTQSRAFTEGLRRENAHYIAVAPYENLIAVQQASLDVLRSVAHDASACARMAQVGMAGLGKAEAMRLDIGLMSRSAEANFEAMLAGRETPQQHGEASDADREAFADRWIASEPGQALALEAFLNNDAGDAAAYCQGALSFQEQLIADDTPGGRRVLAEVTRVMASN